MYSNFKNNFFSFFFLIFYYSPFFFPYFFLYSTRNNYIHHALLSSIQVTRPIPRIYNISGFDVSVWLAVQYYPRKNKKYRNNRTRIIRYPAIKSKQVETSLHTLLKRSRDFAIFKTKNSKPIACLSYTCQCIFPFYLSYFFFFFFF